jgi:hypothetical protein
MAEEVKKILHVADDVLDAGVFIALLAKAWKAIFGEKSPGLPPELVKTAGGLFSKKDEVATLRTLLELKKKSEDKHDLESMDLFMAWANYLFTFQQKPRAPKPSGFDELVHNIEAVIYRNDFYKQLTRLRNEDPAQAKQLINIIIAKIRDEIDTKKKSQAAAFEAVYKEFKGNRLVPVRRVGEDAGESLFKRLNLDILSKRNFNRFLNELAPEWEKMEGWIREQNANTALKRRIWTWNPKEMLGKIFHLPRNLFFAAKKKMRLF